MLHFATKPFRIQRVCALHCSGVTTGGHGGGGHVPPNRLAFFFLLIIEVCDV